MNRRPLSLAVCLIVPFVILVFGLGIAGWRGYEASFELRKEDGRGVVPPGFVVDVSEAGKHTLWLHTYTIFEGEAYESGERLEPGAKILLTDEDTGDTINLNPYASARKSLGSERAISLGTFELLKPARISVLATGVANPVVVSIAPVKLENIMKTIVQVGGIAALTFFASIMTLIILLHRRQKAMQAEEQMHHE